MNNTQIAKELSGRAFETTDHILAGRLLDAASALMSGRDLTLERLRENYRTACAVHGKRSRAAMSAWRELNADINSEIKRLTNV